MLFFWYCTVAPLTELDDEGRIVEVNIDMVSRGKNIMNTNTNDDFSSTNGMLSAWPLVFSVTSSEWFGDITGQTNME